MNKQQDQNKVAGGEQARIKTGVIKALAFFDMFDYPLTAFELWKYLDRACSYRALQVVLEDKELRRAVHSRNGFYFIAGRVELLARRHDRQALSHQKYQKAMRAVRLLRCLNGVKLVAVCNNFSYRADSDIDLFVVVQSGRMWLTRFLTALLLHVFRLRRHGRQVANRLCLSFYVTDDNLDLRSVAYAEDPYFNYWLAWLTPVYDAGSYYERFWQANGWLQVALPNTFACQSSRERQVTDSTFSKVCKKINSLWYDSAGGRGLEKLTKRLQLAKMSKNYSSVAAANDTRVMIGDQILKFHEEDQRLVYRTKMEETIKSLKALINTGDSPAPADEVRPTSNNGLESVRTSGRLAGFVRWGFYALAFFLPWQTRWIISPGELNGAYFEYGTFSLYALDLLILALFMALAYSWLRGENLLTPRDGLAKRRRYGTLILLIAGLDLMLLLSIFFSDHKLLAVYGYLRFLLGVGVFGLVARLSFDKMKLYYAFFAGVFLQSLLAIWQFLSQSTWASKWLGLAWHSAGEGLASVVEVENGGRWLRAYGGLDHPNILGGFLVFGLLLLVWVNVSHQRQHHNFWAFLFLNYLYVPVVTAALFFSFSRSAWLGLAVGLVTALLLAVAGRDLLGQKKILRTVLVVGVVCFTLYASFGELVDTRFSNATRLEKKSSSERLVSLYSAGEVIRSAPLTGVGINTYTSYTHSQRPTSQSIVSYQPVHNVFLLVAAEVGFVGNLFFISIFVFLLLLIFRQCRQLGPACYTLPLLLSLLTMMLFDHWWWSLHFGILFFWLILGLVYREIAAREA